tara:strand:- start:5931 stop:6155 length:225 start_codon:yes stop_codon:yes gene_type:complete
MKLTKSILKQIIKEELKTVLKEKKTKDECEKQLDKDWERDQPDQASMEDWDDYVDKWKKKNKECAKLLPGKGRG